MTTNNQFGPKGWTPELLGSLSGKTYVITGANTGAGFQATRILLSKGAELVMLNRNPNKSEAAIAALKEEFGNFAKVSYIHMDLAELIKEIPKAELHLHIEGTLEPELMMQLARRNGVHIPYNSVEEIRRAYEFTDLQSFLDIYYAGAQVLVTEQDFYDLTWAYLTRAAADNVRHVEIFFDPQTHTERSIAFTTVLDGICGALEAGKTQLGITFRLIMCFLRHLSKDAAMQTLQSSLSYKDRIHAVGLSVRQPGRQVDKRSALSTTGNSP